MLLAGRGALAEQAQLSQPASPVALQFAHAYVNSDMLAPMMRAGVERTIARCLSAGLIDPERLAAIKPNMDLYLEDFLSGIPRVADQVAVPAEHLMSQAELRLLSGFLKSPAWIHATRGNTAAMAEALAEGFPVCSLPKATGAVSDRMVAVARTNVTPQDMAVLRKFAMSSAGQKFIRIAPQLVSTMYSGFRAEAARAAAAAGFAGSPQPAFPPGH